MLPELGAADAIREVVRVLQMLGPVTADPSVVLVSGQAVACWARILGLVPDVATDDFLASKDIDFEGVPAAVTHQLRGAPVRAPRVCERG